MFCVLSAGNERRALDSLSLRLGHSSSVPTLSLSLPLIHLAACFALNSVLVDKHTVSWLVSRLLLVQSEREFALQLSRSVSVPLSLSVPRKETVNSGITRAYQLWINYRITFARESFDCGLNRVFTWNNILFLSFRLVRVSVYWCCG